MLRRNHFYVCDQVGNIVAEASTVAAAKTACRTTLIDDEAFEGEVLEVFRAGDEFPFLTARVCERTGTVAFRGVQGGMR